MPVELYVTYLSRPGGKSSRLEVLAGPLDSHAEAEAIAAETPHARVMTRIELKRALWSSGRSIEDALGAEER